MIPANYSSISFPFLGLEINPPRILEIGPLTIHYYGLIIAIGLVLAVVYSCKRGEEFGLKEDDMELIADCIDRVVNDFEKNADGVRADVNAICAKYPLYE